MAQLPNNGNNRSKKTVYQDVRKEEKERGEL
jgi:hypothetical protein